MVIEVIKPGYKQTELGIMPEDWKIEKLSNLTTLMTNGFVGVATTHYTDSDEGIIYIQGYNVEENSFNFKGIKKVSIEFHKQHLRSCLQEGDLLTIQTGEVGLTTIVPKELVGANCHALIITRFKKNVSSRFFSYYFNSNEGRNRLRLIETGTTMKHINVGDMIHFQVPVPPISEQMNISSILLDLDLLIKNLEKLIRKKNNIKIGTMQKLLIPTETWEEKSIFQIADNKKELFNDGDWIESEHIKDKGIRLIQTGNIGIGKFIEKEVHKYISSESFYKLNCKELNIGDLLICRLAEPAGRACVLPNIGEEKVITSVDVTIFRPRKEIANTIFLSNLFSTSTWFKSISDLCGGTTHKRISRGTLGKIKIFLPPIEQQDKIASILSDMDAEIEELERKRDKYKDIKIGMMQELLTGRIRLK